MTINFVDNNINEPIVNPLENYPICQNPDCRAMPKLSPAEALRRGYPVVNEGVVLLKVDRGYPKFLCEKCNLAFYRAELRYMCKQFGNISNRWCVTCKIHPTTNPFKEPKCPFIKGIITPPPPVKEGLEKLRKTIKQNLA